MSAIIAGDACKTCGGKHWQSFGHPPWYRKDDDPIYQEFCKIQKSGNCLTCYITDCLKDNAFLMWILTSMRAK